MDLNEPSYDIYNLGRNCDNFASPDVYMDYFYIDLVSEFLLPDLYTGDNGISDKCGISSDHLNIGWSLLVFEIGQRYHSLVMPEYGGIPISMWELSKSINIGFYERSADPITGIYMTQFSNVTLTDISSISPIPESNMIILFIVSILTLIIFGISLHRKKGLSVN